MSEQSEHRAIQTLWAKNILTEPFLVLDTETTGIDSNAEAVSIAIIDEKRQPLLNTKLRHTKPCDPEALAVHGITWEETREAPSLKEIHNDLARILKGKTVLIYNANFDTRILMQTYIRYNLPYQDIEFFPIDVMTPFAAFYGEIHHGSGGFKWQHLTKAARYFNISTFGTHGALSDCLMTLNIVKAMAAQRLSEESDGENNG